MAKGSRGLPSNWSVDVPAKVLDRPVKLGDYLDDEVESTSTARVQPEPLRSNPENVVRMPQLVEPARGANSFGARSQIPTTPPVPIEQRGFRSTQRKQLNMNPETLRMVEELLDYIQRYSGQKDAKASEMFHALVSALYEARELVDLQAIPPRGRWGTPTARAFPIALKNSFQKAIAEWFRNRPVVTDR